MLGALAIISAILIVLADRERRSNTPVEQTVTDTITPDAPEVAVEPGAFTEPSAPGVDGAAVLPAALWHADTHPAAVIAPDDETPR